MDHHDISGKVSGIVTSLPIVGGDHNLFFTMGIVCLIFYYGYSLLESKCNTGITACGIFLLMISVIGLIGAVRHHQVLHFLHFFFLTICHLSWHPYSCRFFSSSTWLCYSSSSSFRSPIKPIKQAWANNKHWLHLIQVKPMFIIFL